MGHGRWQFDFPWSGFGSARIKEADGHFRNRFRRRRNNRHGHKVAAMKTSGLEWAVSAAAIRGETESGDLHVVEAFAHGVLMAAIDGLGHGVAAAAAARSAARLITTNPGENVIRLVEQCDHRLHKTRGVVMSLASINTTE